MHKAENPVDDAACPPAGPSDGRKTKGAARAVRKRATKGIRLPKGDSLHEDKQEWIQEVLDGVDLADPGARLACLREVTVRRLLTLLVDAKLDTRLMVKLCDLMDITGSSATKALAEASVDDLGGFIGGLSAEDRAIFDTLR